MAKIVKITVYGQTLYAMQMPENVYIDENGVKYFHLTKENCKNTRNVPPKIRVAFEHLEKIYARQKKLETKRKKMMQEMDAQIRALENEESAALKELREAQGVMDIKEFIDTFYEALPANIKFGMQKYGYEVGETPLCYGYDDAHFYIVRNIEVYKYNKNIPYAYEEYDGQWCLCDEAEEMEAYKNDVKRNERKLPVSASINSYLWTGDKFSTWYSGVYEIELKEKLTEGYAKDLARQFSK